jgi:hypothetical protein
MKMREEKKVVYVLRRNWDGELYRGLVGKLPMTFESNEEAEEYLRRHNFGSPYAVAVYAPTHGGEIEYASKRQSSARFEPTLRKTK